jgi:hypothetical protein
MFVLPQNTQHLSVLRLVTVRPPTGRLSLPTNINSRPRILSVESKKSRKIL